MLPEPATTRSENSQRVKDHFPRSQKDDALQPKNAGRKVVAYVGRVGRDSFVMRRKGDQNPPRRSPMFARLYVRSPDYQRAPTPIPPFTIPWPKSLRKLWS